MSKDTDEVIALERRFWTETNDPRLFREVMADDGIAVIEPMGVIDKAKAVEYSAQGKPFRDVELTDVVIRQPTPDASSWRITARVATRARRSRTGGASAPSTSGVTAAGSPC